MTDDFLVEQDPELDGIVDKQSRRNLLENPRPLTVDTSSGKPSRIVLEIRNGEKGLIDLAISSDETWLQPEASRLTLVGGESGDCALSIAPEGDTEYANLILAWEGIERTCCDSIMVLRKVPGATPPGSKQTGSEKSPAGPGEKPISEAVQTLKQFINSCGGPDKFIDKNEEDCIFRKGASLGLSVTQTESVLNRQCAQGGWTRQYRLSEKLTAMLHEATKDDGAIDQQKFDRIVNFAVRRCMPWKDATEHCVTLILDNNWKAKESFLKKWFTNLCKEFRLR